MKKAVAVLVVVFLVVWIGAAFPVFAASLDPPFGTLATFTSPDLNMFVGLLPEDAAAGAILSCLQDIRPITGKVVTCLKIGGSYIGMPNIRIEAQGQTILFRIHLNRCDINGDLKVDIKDYQLLAQVYVGTAECPMATCKIASPTVIGPVTLADVNAWVDAYLGIASCPL